MNPNNPIKNPMLCGAMELLKAEDNQEHRKLFIDELMKAHLLAPVIIDPAPQPDENGRVRMVPGCKMQFPMLPTKDGVQFFMAFTDWDELKKWNPNEPQQTMAFGFDDYANLLLRKNKDGQLSPAMGFVINPFSNNIVVTREMVAKFMAAKMLGRGVQIPRPNPAAQQENVAEEAEENPAAEE